MRIAKMGDDIEQYLSDDFDCDVSKLDAETVVINCNFTSKEEVKAFFDKLEANGHSGYRYNKHIIKNNFTL